MLYLLVLLFFSSWWYTDPETFEKFTPSSKFPPLWCYELGKLALHWPHNICHDDWRRCFDQNCPSFQSLNKNDFLSFRSCRTYRDWVKVDLKCNLEITFHWKHPLASHMTGSQYKGKYLSGCVPENLTLCRIHKIIFKKYHVKALDQSFPMMYNTI